MGLFVTFSCLFALVSHLGSFTTASKPLVTTSMPLILQRFPVTCRCLISFWPHLCMLYSVLKGYSIQFSPSSFIHGANFFHLSGLTHVTLSLSPSQPPYQSGLGGPCTAPSLPLELPSAPSLTQHCSSQPHPIRCCVPKGRDHGLIPTALGSIHHMVVCFHCDHLAK